MPGPTTEFLSTQIDQVRNEVSVLGKEIQGARLVAIDGLRDLGDTFTGQLGEIREHVGGELTRLRQEVGAGREALKMEQSLIREDIARLQVQTGELIARFDRVLGFLKALLLALIGVGITVLGAVAGAFWNASRVYHAVEDHSRRIEKLEGEVDVDRARLQRSIERVQKTLDARLPAVGQ